jgi:hypothetical protein
LIFIVAPVSRLRTDFPPKSVHVWSVKYVLTKAGPSTAFGAKRAKLRSG